MSSETDERSERTAPSGIRGTLRPFHGSICPGIGFESGHTIWLFRFHETPTPVGAYSEVWVEAPDGELTLYADPEEAVPYVSAHHEFDRIETATIEWRRTDDEALEVATVAADGTTLALYADLTRTLRTRAMEALATLTPDSILRTPVGGAVSSLSYALLVGSGGTKLLGRTETGVRYRGDADRILAVGSATAVLDGTDLGATASPRSTRTYGDVSTAANPHVVIGRLHFEYPAPGQPSAG